MSTSGRRAPARLGRAGADARTRQPRGDRRRQQILDAAVDLFGAKGYRGTGVAALAERVGMTATGLLYYFGSKARLLQEVVAERDRVRQPDFMDLTLAQLREVGTYNVATAKLTRLYAVLAAESFDPSDPLHDYFVGRYEMARHLARTALEAEREQGRLRADVDVDQQALEIISVLIGLETQWLIDPERVDLAAAFETYMDRVIADVAC